jgi:hypothetical protein
MFVPWLIVIVVVRRSFDFILLEMKFRLYLRPPAMFNLLRVVSCFSGGAFLIYLFYYKRNSANSLVWVEGSL